MQINEHGDDDNDDVPWSVSPCVCLLVTTVNPTEPYIAMYVYNLGLYCILFRKF